MKIRPERIDHKDALAVARIDEGGAASRRSLRVVDRTDQPRRPLDEDERLALVPGMVAERDGVGAGADEVLIDRLGDAESAGGVLGVDDDEIELPVADRPGRRSSTMARPLRPTMSPMNRIRTSLTPPR